MNWRMELHLPDGHYWIDNASSGGDDGAVKLLAHWPARRAGDTVEIEGDNGRAVVELTDVVKLNLEVTA